MTGTARRMWQLFEPLHCPAARAAARDVLANNELVTDAARAAELATPVLDACHVLFAETVASGHGSEDMISVLHALDARSGSGDAP